jgi:hypothetical protein
MVDAADPEEPWRIGRPPIFRRQGLSPCAAMVSPTRQTERRRAASPHGVRGFMTRSGFGSSLVSMAGRWSRAGSCSGRPRVQRGGGMNVRILCDLRTLQALGERILWKNQNLIGDVPTEILRTVPMARSARANSFSSSHNWHRYNRHSSCSRMVRTYPRNNRADAHMALGKTGGPHSKRLASDKRALTAKDWPGDERALAAEDRSGEKAALTAPAIPALRNSV